MQFLYLRILYTLTRRFVSVKNRILLLLKILSLFVFERMDRINLFEVDSSLLTFNFTMIEESG